MTVTICQFIFQDGDFFKSEISSGQFSTTLLVISVCLFPFCLISDIKKFKIIGYFVLLADLAMLINVLLLSLIEKPGKVTTTNSIFDITSPWAYLYEYSNMFQFHIYFLWIMQSTGEKQQNREGKKMANIVSVCLFAFVILFSAFGLIGYKTNLLSDEPINER